MRKCVLLAAALLLSAVSLFAQKSPLTPYEYGHRWYFMFQGGPLYFNSDYCSNMWAEGRVDELLTFSTGLALGYNFDDANAIQVMANYARKTGVCEPFESDLFNSTTETIPTYTYKFRSVQCFVDYVINFNALAEYFMSFSAKCYAGLGAAYTFDFTEPEHPEVWVTDPNLVPALNFGFIVEYDFKDGFGFFLDLGLAFYTDRYNGREPISFPLEMDDSVQIGLIYHIPFKAGSRR